MSNNDRFSSRWGLILASLGMAIGTGNIWRFPRIIAQNGGGSFLVPWLIFLFTWSIPLLILESAMGKKARQGTVGTFATLVGPRAAWQGAFIGFNTMAIGFYYCVVTGWCFHYLGMSLSGGMLDQDAQQVWDTFSTSRWLQVGFHLLALVLCTMVIQGGISRGIERLNRILIPSLFLILILAAIRAVTLPGAVDGLNFLFTFRLEDLCDYHIWLEGLSQSAWSTGAGAGLILTYAAYASRKQNVVFSSVMTGLGNNSASLLAALAIIPTVFAVLPRELALETITTPGPASTGMSFIYLPQLLQEIPGGRYFFLPLFFVALTFAAVSSMIAVLQLGVRNFEDFGLSRRKAVTVMFAGTFLLGMPSALSATFFSNQDWVWGLGLTVCGFFFARTVHVIGQKKLCQEWINSAPGWKVGRRFGWMLMWLIPVQFVVLLGWCLVQAILGDREGWWNPLGPTNFGTAITQWGLMMLIFFLLNPWLNRMREKAS